jgi:hypothetical protein
MTKQNWKRTKYFSKYEWVTQQVTKSRKDITRVRISEHQQIIQNKTQKGKVKEKKKNQSQLGASDSCLLS